MKKNWWLELYTIPALRKIGAASLLVMVVNVALAVYYFNSNSFILIANLYVFYVFNKTFDVSLSSNIEFHKLHVPFHVLRAAWVKDALIKVAFVNLACLLNIIVTYALVDEPFLSPTLLFFLFIYLLGSILNVLKIGGLPTDKKRPYRLYDKERIGFFKHILTMSFFILFGTVASLTILASHMSFYVHVLFGFLGTLLGTSYFLYRSVFHQEVKRGTARTAFKYYFLGWSLSFTVYVGLSFLTRPLITLPVIPADVRFVIFQSGGVFAPTIDIKTAQEFLAINRDSVDFENELIFKKTKRAGQIPVRQFLGKGSAVQYLEYGTTVKGMSKENIQLYLEAIAAGKIPRKMGELLAERLIPQWPKGEKMPEHLLAKNLFKKDQGQVERIPTNDGEFLSR